MSTAVEDRKSRLRDWSLLLPTEGGAEAEQMLPLALSLAIGLLPVAGAIASDVVGHMPSVEFPQQWGPGHVPYGDGWRGGWHWWWHHHATNGSGAP